MATTLATKNDTQRPTRFNTELFRKETYCHGHWWAGDTCLYGAHSLTEEVKEVETESAPHVEEQSAYADRLHNGVTLDRYNTAVESQNSEESLVRREQERARQLAAIHDGFYTVLLPGDKHRTFRLQTQGPDASFAPGKQIIGFLAGSDNTHDYVNFAFIIDGEIKLWRRFLHGYEMVVGAACYLVSGNHADEAGKMYAKESGNCYICNRMLTTPESLAVGIGPTCARKVA